MHLLGSSWRAPAPSAAFMVRWMPWHVTRMPASTRDEPNRNSMCSVASIVLALLTGERSKGSRVKKFGVLRPILSNTRRPTFFPRVTSCLSPPSSPVVTSPRTLLIYPSLSQLTICGPVRPRQSSAEHGILVSPSAGVRSANTQTISRLAPKVSYILQIHHWASKGPRFYQEARRNRSSMGQARAARSRRGHLPQSHHRVHCG